jgi:hypothetical protein
MNTVGLKVKETTKIDMQAFGTLLKKKKDLYLFEGSGL